MIALNFPNNPTGVIARRETFDGIVELCRQRDIYRFSDEDYRGLERDPALRLPQAADLYDTTLSLNVIGSKAYGLAGPRIGWIASRDHALLSRMERIKHYLSICIAARPKCSPRSRSLRESLLFRATSRCAATTWRR